MTDLERAKQRLDHLDELRRDYPEDRRIRWSWKEAQAIYLRLEAEEARKAEKRS